MRISDWSSDVCSSDLLHAGGAAAQIAIDQNDPCPSQRCGSGEANSRCGLAFAGQRRRDGYYGGLLVGPGEMDRGAQTAERFGKGGLRRSEEHTSELQSLMRISYAVFCLKTKTRRRHTHNTERVMLTITT